MMLLSLCFSSSGAENLHVLGTPRFIPDTYVQYQRWGMTTQELAVVRDAPIHLLADGTVDTGIA